MQKTMQNAEHGLLEQLHEYNKDFKLRLRHMTALSRHYISNLSVAARQGRMLSLMHTHMSPVSEKKISTHILSKAWVMNQRDALLQACLICWPKARLAPRLLILVWKKFCKHVTSPKLVEVISTYCRCIYLRCLGAESQYAERMMIMTNRSSIHRCEDCPHTS